MVGPRVACALLVAVLLAGCAGGGAGDDAPGAAPGPSGGTQTSTGPAQAEGNDTPVLEEGRGLTLFFTSDGGLSLDLPSEGTVPIGSAATGFVTGFRPREFLSAPFANATVVLPQDITVTAYVTSSLPQLSNGGFDFAVQVGSTVASGLWSFIAGPVKGPGETNEYRVTLSFGEQEGLYVPLGESLRALVFGQFGGESGEPRMRVGGASASRIELGLANYTRDPLARAQDAAPERFTGTLTGVFTIPTCDAAPGTTSLTHDVQVAADAVSFAAGLRSGGGQDVDLDVFDGTRLLTSGHSALGEETVLLAADTLAGLQGKTLRLKATSCGSGPVPYTIDVQQMTAPAAA